MRSHTIYIYFFVLAILFSTKKVFAQESIRVNSSIDRNSILIGERIRLVYEADIPETLPIRFFAIDTIEHFEFIEKGKIDTINTSTGTRLRQEFVITSFDSGQWVIPSYVLDMQNQVFTDSFVVNVGFTPYDTSLGYHGIKEIIEAKPAEEANKKNWFYLAAIGTLILIALIYILTRKKKPETITVIPVDPFTEAMKQLDILKTRDGLTPKDYYTRLTDVFRNYLARKKNISSMQKTTDELVMQIRDLKMETGQFNQLAQALRLCDFVKFAKYQPAPEDDRLVYDSIRNSIQSIENLSA